MGFFGVVNLRAVDWPNFLGPNKNGISTETGLIGSWSTGGPKVEWKKQIGTVSKQEKRIVLTKENFVGLAWLHKWKNVVEGTRKRQM